MINYLKKYQKLLVRALLSIITCFLVINLAAPARSISPIANPMSPPIDFAQLQLTAHETSLHNYQQQAKSVLMAQGNPEKTLVSRAMSLKSYGAVLSGNDIVPSRVSTPAQGTLGAVLEGNRLVVRGSFHDLTSLGQDYPRDTPVSSTPRVTSPMHIHLGTGRENGQFQYALAVQFNPDGLGGIVKGDYTLTEEQLQSLNSGQLYVDLHTQGFRGGELRGAIEPY